VSAVVSIIALLCYAILLVCVVCLTGAAWVLRFTISSVLTCAETAISTWTRFRGTKLNAGNTPKSSSITSC